MKVGEWDNLGRARGLVQRQLGELGTTEYAAHVTVNPDNGRLRIFVATDALDMQQRLLQMPNAFALRKGFPPAGTGHQFADFDGDGGYTDVESINETIIDMFMLAECQGLVCNESSFNLFAQHKTMFFCGNVRLLERYFEHPVKRLARGALGARTIRRLRGLRR